MQTLHEALQDNPLIAFEVWAACRVRWQEQLKAPTETVLQILDNKPSGSRSAKGIAPPAASRTVPPAALVEKEPKPTTPQTGDTTTHVKEEVDWDAREDQDVVTPPFLDEDDTTDMPWTDLKGTEGDKQPVTPDLIVEFDDETGKHRVQTKWSQTCAISGHLRLRLPRCFATSQWLNCARSGGCLTPPHLHKLRPLMGGNPAKRRGDKDKTLDQDELVKQVMEELRNQEGTGGTKPQREEEFVEIDLDADTRIRPATSMATDAGDRLWPENQEEAGGR